MSVEEQQKGEPLSVDEIKGILTAAREGRRKYTARPGGRRIFSVEETAAIAHDWISGRDTDEVLAAYSLDSRDQLDDLLKRARREGVPIERPKGLPPEALTIIAKNYGKIPARQIVPLVAAQIGREVTIGHITAVATQRMGLRSDLNSWEYRETHSVDLEFFEKPLTADQCYVVGFLVANGNLYHKEGSGYQIRFVIRRSDRQLLEAIKGVMQFEGKIIDKRRKFKTGRTLYSYLNIARQKLFEDLNALGIHQAETNIELFDRIPEEYRRCFLRGLLDGDGYCGTSSEGYASLSFDNGNSDFVDRIEEMVAEITGIEKGSKNKTGSKVLYSGKDALLVAAALYFQNGGLALARKERAFLQNLLKAKTDPKQQESRYLERIVERITRYLEELDQTPGVAADDYRFELLSDIASEYFKPTQVYRLSKNYLHSDPQYVRAATAIFDHIKGRVNNVTLIDDGCLRVRLFPAIIDLDEQDETFGEIEDILKDLNMLHV